MARQEQLKGLNQLRELSLGDPTIKSPHLESLRDFGSLVWASGVYLRGLAGCGLTAGHKTERVIAGNEGRGSYHTKVYA